MHETITAQSAIICHEVNDLADQIGSFIEYWGFKRVHGKIWAHIYLSNRPLDAKDLMERLNISKALVSMSLTELKGYGVISERGKSDKGTITYYATSDVLSAVFNVLRSRERKLLTRIYDAYQTVCSVDLKKQEQMGIDKKRLKKLGRLIIYSEKFLQGILNLTQINLSHWRYFKGQ